MTADVKNFLAVEEAPLVEVRFCENFFNLAVKLFSFFLLVKFAAY
jgi:hypothetical protein